ncbi:MAG: hypothetical protein Harvfovirus51_4 [Harvfovirus sp.]|uniref:Uncharacterized protein n=1 Tax=Harvfovirus sp. TaxID=2487768 RepID=A0A3G5A361_9VIRU|nr:MAG: hypothetical protein Harvfovirus51_4 [Harvfovirus sp.]
MGSTNSNANDGQVYQEETPFWSRTTLGIPNWLWGLIILLVLLYLAWKGKYLSGDEGKKTGTLYFGDRGLMNAPVISPVENRFAGLY